MKGDWHDGKPGCNKCDLCGVYAETRIVEFCGRVDNRLSEYGYCLDVCQSCTCINSMNSMTDWKPYKR